MITTKNTSKTVTLLLSFIALVIFLPFQNINAQLAKKDAKWVGNIIRNNVPSNFDGYWNAITMENAGKWSEMERNKGKFSWQENTNNILVQSYNKAISKGYPFKAHTFVWRNQAPGWLPGLNANEQRAAVDRMMRGYLDRFPKTALIDVVNEPLDGHAPAYGTNGGWMKFNGNNDIGKWSWIKWAFERAKAAREATGSDALLLINDYSILENDNNTNQYIDLIKKVNANGRNLIEGIGVQAHYAYNSRTCGSYTLNISKTKRNLDKLATLGLPIYVSEFDMNIGDNQEQDYKFMALFKLFYEHPAVKGVTLWGFNKGNWVPCSWLVDGSNERPALKSLRNYLANVTTKPETETGGQTGGQTGGDFIFSPGNIITLKGNNSRYLSSENGKAFGMTCNRNNVGSWEKFTIVNAGNGLIALKGNNGAFVCSENGNSQGMSCDRTVIQEWEKFDPVFIANGVYGFRANNGKYVSSEDGRQAITANRDVIGTWEKFNVTKVGTGRRGILTNNSQETTILAYPNPANSTINIDLTQHTLDGEASVIQIYDLLGRLMSTQNSNDAITTLSISELNAGRYFVSVISDNAIFKTSFTKRN